MTGQLLSSLPRGLASFSLAGRVALITGAGRGIGFSFAAGLALAGAHVVINDLRQAAAEEAVEKIRAQGASAEAAVFDVTDRHGVAEAVDGIVARNGRLDILVNNAGILIRKPIELHDMDDWNQVIDVNLSSLYNVARACVPLMRQRQYGRIINTASVMAISSRPGVISYVAAKHGVVGLTRGLAAELGRDRITVNAIGPGYILTEMNAKVLGHGNFEETVNQRTPLARWAHPDELQGAAIFLASDAASFVTGHLLMVDGGMTANAFLTESEDLGKAS